MPTDLELDDTKDITLDGGNDLALVSGRQQLQQSIAIDVFDELQEFIGDKMDGTSIGKLEEAIRRGLNDDPQVDEVTSVSIDTYDKTTDTIEVSVSVRDNDDFSLELSA